MAQLSGGDGVHDVYCHDLSDQRWSPLKLLAAHTASSTSCPSCRFHPGSGRNGSTNHIGNRKIDRRSWCASPSPQSLFQNFGDATTANLLHPCSGCEHLIDTLLENVGYVDDNVFPLHTRSGHSAETTLCPELGTMALSALPTLMSQWLGIIRQNSSLVRHLRICGACNSLPPLQRRAHPLRHSPAATNGVAGRTR